MAGARFAAQTGVCWRRFMEPILSSAGGGRPIGCRPVSHLLRWLPPGSPSRSAGPRIRPRSARLPSPGPLSRCLAMSAPVWIFWPTSAGAGGVRGSYLVLHRGDLHLGRTTHHASLITALTSRRCVGPPEPTRSASWSRKRRPCSSKPTRTSSCRPRSPMMTSNHDSHRQSRTGSRRCQPSGDRHWAGVRACLRASVHTLAVGRVLEDAAGKLRASCGSGPSQEAGAGFSDSAVRRYSALMRRASSSWSSRMTMRQAASTGVPWSTSSRARAAMRSW